VFTAWYALSPYIKQIRFVFKGLMHALHMAAGLIFPYSIVLITLEENADHEGSKEACRPWRLLCEVQTLKFLSNSTGYEARSPSLLYLLVHSRCRGCLFSLDHTQTHTTFGMTPLDEGSARRRDLYMTTQTLYKRQTSMLPVGFEPTIPASARPQTYALDRAVTGIGDMRLLVWNFFKLQLLSASLETCFKQPESTLSA
jgi:hypothetical protein